MLIIGCHACRMSIVGDNDHFDMLELGEKGCFEEKMGRRVVDKTHKTMWPTSGRNFG